MIRMTIALISVASAIQIATAEDLVLELPRHSMYIGETIKCIIKVDKSGLRSGKQSNRLKSVSLPPEYSWPSYSEGEFSFCFSPSKQGVQELGPIELSIGGIRLKSNVSQISVLEERNEDFFEIRVLGDTITTNQYVEVAVQLSKNSKRPNPYVPSQKERCSTDSRFFVKEHPLWDVRMVRQPMESYYVGKRKRQNALRSDKLWHYEFRCQVAHLYPKKKGDLTVDKSLFINIPKDYKFEPHRVQVTEKANKTNRE